MRSSSSSDREGKRPFARSLGRSLAALRSELPWIYARLCHELAPREVAITVDGERVSVAAGREELAVLEAPRDPAVRAVTSRRAILDLIDARLTLPQAVWDGHVELYGAVPDLAAFHDGLMIYLHGAVRAPSFPALLRSFREESR